RPDSVSRVAPPTRTMTNTRAAIVRSHSLMARCRTSAVGKEPLRSLADGGADHIERPKARQSACCRAAGMIRGDNDHPHPQVCRRIRPAGSRAVLGAAGHGLRPVRADLLRSARCNTLLRGCRARLDLAGHAAGALDVAARCRQTAITLWAR